MPVRNWRVYIYQIGTAANKLIAGAGKIQLLLAALSVLLVLSLVPGPGQAKSSPHFDWTGSPLSLEQQAQLEKAWPLCQSGQHALADPYILGALQSATDIPQCLSIAVFTEPYAYPMMEVRRQCLQKALSLCVTRSDFLNIAVKSRQYQFYEITRQAINSLMNNANTLPDLWDLARKAQEASLNDVSRMAMDKAYAGINNVPDAVRFAAEVKEIGMDDLSHKVVKDLLDDEDNCHQLCLLVKNLESLDMPDLMRYGLKKALDKAQTVQDCVDITDAARRNNQTDIYKVAEYRGKKLKIITQIKQDQAEYKKQMEAWQEHAQQNLTGQPAAQSPPPAAEPQSPDSGL